MGDTYKTMVHKRHILHSSIFNQTLRNWQSLKTEISPRNLMYPVFIIEQDDEVQNIPSMPGVHRYGINQLRDHLSQLVQKGLTSILVFGVIDSLKKNDFGTNADSPQNPVIRALPLVRRWFPDLTIACDVCLCPYSSHGHCGILTSEGIIDNAKSIKRIAEIALAYAKAALSCDGCSLVKVDDVSPIIPQASSERYLKQRSEEASRMIGEPLVTLTNEQPTQEKSRRIEPSSSIACGVSLANHSFIIHESILGAHIVAPSDMMDGRIGAIKTLLIEHNLQNTVSMLSYTCKFASSFYGPFRDAAKSAPSFGDRKCYQLPPGGEGIALRAAERDVEEGADFLMVKPIMAYIDILKQVKDRYPEYPMFVYQVSGEYSMILSAAEKGIFDLKAGLMEILSSFRRAGADVIITYFTPLILDWIQLKHKL